MIAAAGRRGLVHGAAALALLGLLLALFWPGTALFDSVYQYEQAVSGAYDDWHPPIMAHLWALLGGIAPGTAPMLLLQLGLYWVGLGLLAAACARRGRGAAGWAILAVGASSLLSCWMGAILKDSQMAGALAAAAGIVGWYRLEERRVPWWAAAIAFVLMLYAVFVRANAVFAVVPLGLSLFGWVRLRSLPARAAACLALIAAIILVTPAVNQRLLGAERSGVENSLLLFDIAGTAIRARADDVAGVPAARWAAVAAHGCYNVRVWDQLGEPDCEVDPRLTADPDSPPLYHIWLTTLLHHPFAYAAHRIAHFNATMRLIVPANLPGALSPIDTEANTLGLGRTPGEVERAFWRVGTWWTALPLSWPALWLALALVALWPAVTAPKAPERDVALALLLSAACGGLSYGVVSIAADLRYHLWTMLAAALGLVLLAAAGAVRRRHVVALAAAAALVAVAGVAARLTLPPLPPIA